MLKEIEHSVYWAQLQVHRPWYGPQNLEASKAPYMYLLLWEGTQRERPRGESEGLLVPVGKFQYVAGETHQNTSLVMIDRT